MKRHIFIKPYGSFRCFIEFTWQFGVLIKWWRVREIYGKNEHFVTISVPFVCVVLGFGIPTGEPLQ